MSLVDKSQTLHEDKIVYLPVAHGARLPEQGIVTAGN